MTMNMTNGNMERRENGATVRVPHGSTVIATPTFNQFNLLLGPLLEQVAIDIIGDLRRREKHVAREDVDEPNSFPAAEKRFLAEDDKSRFTTSTASETLPSEVSGGPEAPERVHSLNARRRSFSRADYGSSDHEVVAFTEGTVSGVFSDDEVKNSIDSFGEPSSSAIQTCDDSDSIESHDSLVGRYVHVSLRNKAFDHPRVVDESLPRSSFTADCGRDVALRMPLRGRDSNDSYRGYRQTPGEDSLDGSVLSTLPGTMETLSDAPPKPPRRRSSANAASSHPVMTTTSNGASASCVGFSNVHVRFYERIMSDNPACAAGPSIGIGWQYDHDEDVTLPVDEWEHIKRCQRQGRGPVLLSRPERERLVRRLGYSDREIAANVRELNRVRFRRRQTVNNLSMEKLEESMESMRSRVKKVFISTGGHKLF